MAIPEDILRANLARLERTEPALAETLRATTPATLAWVEAGKGLWSASVARGMGDGGAEATSGVTTGATSGASSGGLPGASGGAGVSGGGAGMLALASRYDPMVEAQRLIATVDHRKHAGIFVLGMGLGYHVALLAERIADGSVMVVYEPDAGLMRAVLERVDHTAWLGRSNIIVLCGEPDRAALLGRVDRLSGLITQGTALVTHPPTRQLHPRAISEFGKCVTEVVAYCRTSIATALVNASRTIANLTAAVPYYVAGANTNELHEAARGVPAVCVSAGPSLARNIALLADPAVRRNVVLITAQTTLKPLLDRGIRPDFVTALDYHEISRRFYEGLPELPDVTLVAEPKAHPSILDQYPGPIRVTANNFLKHLLGEVAPAITPIPDGTTVAHLSFYLAQHLGCDPIIMIGQDLGFSDGLYYCPGTAIHDVWAPELGAFNTLEMMEWQRIVRHRHHLQRLEDVHGQPIYSDEQMLTYLKQFERDFAGAKQTVIDATEGGLAKRGAARMTLAEALARYATQPAPALPRPGRALDGSRLEAAGRLLRGRRDEVNELRQLSQRTGPILSQMAEHQRDMARMKKLFNQLEPIQKRVGELREAFAMVNQLNTVGAFKRARADRAIHHEQERDEFARQRQQLERDRENIDWLVQSCDETLAIFDTAIARVESRMDGRGAMSAAAAGGAG